MQTAWDENPNNDTKWNQVERNGNNHGKMNSKSNGQGETRWKTDEQELENRRYKDTSKPNGQAKIEMILNRRQTL